MFKIIINRHAAVVRTNRDVADCSASCLSGVLYMASVIHTISLCRKYEQDESRNTEHGKQKTTNNRNKLPLGMTKLGYLVESLSNPKGLVPLFREISPEYNLASIVFNIIL